MSDRGQACGPVFVVGVNGSGTTMLADALGRHSALYMLPYESKVLPYFASRFSDGTLIDPAERARLARDLAAAKAFSQCNGWSTIDLGSPDTLPASFAGIVDRMYMRFARVAGKERWADKSPMNLHHIGMLAERFANASFIHIYRDGRDAAQSFHRRWRQHPRRMMWRWKQAVREGRRQGHALAPGRYLEVCYEHLTEDPEFHLARVCDFLGLPFEAAMLDSPMRWMDPQSKASAQGRIVRNSNRWRKYFDPAQVAALEDIAGQLLAELGYETERQGDANPSRWKLQLWRALDRWHFTIDHFRQYGWRSVPSYLKRIDEALRQSRVGRTSDS